MIGRLQVDWHWSSGTASVDKLPRRGANLRKEQFERLFDLVTHMQYSEHR